MAVPLQNVYYLLCYAWNKLEARGLVDRDSLAGNRVENLLGKVLEVGVGHLIRRGLDRGYVDFDEEGRRLRGKLLLTETMTRALLPAGRVVCRVDELSHDVPHNRVIKAAMRALMSLDALDKALKTHLRQHCQRMSSVADIALDAAAFRKVQLHRNLAHYAFLVNIAELVARSFMPDEGTGRERFHPFTADERQMGSLFEAFVYNFLSREQRNFRVSRNHVGWDLEPSPTDDQSWLPTMKTDVMLTNASQRVVIETKYYATPYQAHYGIKKLRSGHLYQLLSYVTNLRATPGPHPTGVLLYASDGETRRLDYRIQGHPILVRSLDLNRGWLEIHDELLGLARELAGRGEARASV